MVDAAVDQPLPGAGVLRGAARAGVGRYTYVNGDPINLTDPDGHEPRANHNFSDRNACARGACGYAAQSATYGTNRPVDKPARSGGGGSWLSRAARGAYNTVAGAGAGVVHVASDFSQTALTYSPAGAALDSFGLLDPITIGLEGFEKDFVRFQRDRLGVDTGSRAYKFGDKGTQIASVAVPGAGGARAVVAGVRAAPAAAARLAAATRRRVPLPSRGGRAPGDPPVLLRGTSEGFAGSPGLRAAGVTPTTTDPVVATAFAIHAQQFGTGIVHVASPADLAGVKILPGNVLSRLEREVAVAITPSEFAARAGLSIPSTTARSVLSDMGYSLPGSIPTPGALQSVLEMTGRMSPAEIATFITRVGG